MSQTASNTALHEFALRLGDDALTLGHRLSEWCSNGPYLEEDIALSNIALDHIGRARMLLGYAAEVEGKGRSEDDLAFLRHARQFRNLLLFELPKGDFAFTIARQFFVDVFHAAYFAALTQSSDEALAGIAGKAVKECRYHQRHTAQWMLRLGDGTEESHERLQKAVDQLWGYLPELFDMDDLESGLANDGIAVDRSNLRDALYADVSEVLNAATITVPESEWRQDGGRNGIHTEYLGHLLAEMQFMQRAYPGMEW